MIVEYLNNIFGMTFDMNALLRALPKVLDYCKPRYHHGGQSDSDGELGLGPNAYSSRRL